MVYRNKNSKLLVLAISIFLPFIHTQNQNEEISKFLENIKQAIQKTQKLKLKSQNLNSKFKTEKNIRKLKARKMIMGKVTNPFYKFKQQHVILQINNKKLTMNLRSSTAVNEKKRENKTRTITSQPSITNYYLPATINKVLRQNPALMPFKIPAFPKQIASSKTATNHLPLVTGDKPIPEYINDLKQWYLELSQQAKNFWVFFKKFFIDNKEGFNYLNNVICRNEIKKDITSEKIFKDYPVTGIGTSDIFDPAFEKAGNALKFIFSYFSPLKSVGYGASYNISSKVINSCDTLIKYNEGQYSLCSNLANLNLLGICALSRNGDIVDTKPLDIVFFCLKSFVYSDNNYLKLCKNLEANMDKAYKMSKKWFKLANDVYRKQIIPAIVDMCYNSCKCENLGIKCLRNPDGKRQIPEAEYMGMLIYHLIKSNFREKVNKLYYIYYNLSQIKDSIDEKKCPSISSTIKTEIENFINNMNKLRAENIIKDVDNLDSLAFGCLPENSGFRCAFTNGMCRNQNPRDCSQFSAEAFYGNIEGAKYLCESGGYCLWNSADNKCITPVCKSLNKEQCYTLENSCIWDEYFTPKKCKTIDDYCLNFPEPGKGFLNRNLLKEMGEKITAIEMEIERLKTRFSYILANSNDNLFCNTIVLRKIVDNPNFSNLNLSYSDIVRNLDSKDKQNYILLFNLKKIFDLTNSIPIKLPSVDDYTLLNLENFLSSWLSGTAGYLFYIDYYLINHYLDYKIQRCSGTLTAFEDYLNSVISSSNSAEMKKTTKDFFLCMYKEKEFLKCLNTSYRGNKNYDLYNDIINGFFNIAGNIDVANLESSLRKFQSKSGTDFKDLIPQIKESCNKLFGGNDDFLLKSCKLFGKVDLTLSGCCPTITQIDISNLQTFSPDLNLPKCTAEIGCKFCYDTTIGHTFPVVRIETEKSCNGCEDDKKEKCKNIGKNINNAIEVIVQNIKEAEAIDLFRSEWRKLIEFIKGNFCVFKGMDEKYCKKGKSIFNIDLENRDKFREKLKDLFGNDAYILYERAMKNVLDDKNILDNVDCNKL